MKLTKRKGFNFFRSYYDVYNELNDEEKISFMDALLDRQFLGKKPENLSGMAKFAYISQTNSIDGQVDGYNSKAKQLKRPLLGNLYTPATPPSDGGKLPPAAQEKGEEKGKEETTIAPPPETKIDVVDFDECIKQISKSQIWSENFYMQFKLSNGSLKKLLARFKTSLNLKPLEDHPKNHKAFVGHFTNWCNVQDRIGKLDEMKKNKSKVKGAL